MLRFIFIIFIFIIGFHYSSTARANYFYEIAEKTSLGSVMNTPKIESTVAYGIGNIQNGVVVNSTSSLSTTNNNFHILAAKFNKFNLQTNIPFKDSVESRRSRVDTDAKTLSAGVDYLENFNTELFYRSYSGYFIFDSKTSKVMFVLPNFGYENFGVTTTYSDNPDHHSSYSDLLFYNKRKDSSAILYFAKFSQLNFHNIEELNNWNFANSAKSNLNAASIDSANISIAYSRNWFWKNWFTAAVLGAGYGLNLIDATNQQGLKKISTDTATSSIVGFSLGYTWRNNVSLTMNANVTTSTTLIEKLSISNSNGTSGLYLSYNWF